jgi:outer membrane protein
MQTSLASSVALFIVAMTASAQAQDSAKPLWEIGAFAGVANTPAYPGSADRTSRALLMPTLIYRGDIIRAERGSIGARLVHTDNMEFDLGFSGSLPANTQDNSARKGMPDLGTLIEFGPRLKMTLAHPAPGSRVRLEVPVRTVLEFNNGVNSQGIAFEPELVYEQLDVGAGWRLSASGSLVFGDSKLNNFFYGVTPQYATATRPTYDAQAGLIATRLAMSTAKSLTPDLRVFGFVRYESYAGAANLNSPLHQSTNGAAIGMGLTWTLGRSEERAKN